jgi:limonene-1,2-epoxide hydrolase
MNFPKIRSWMRTTRRDPDRIIFERSRAKVQAHNSLRAQLRFCHVYQIRDGKIIGLQIYFDVASLLTYVDVAVSLQEFRRGA